MLSEYDKPFDLVDDINPYEIGNKKKFLNLKLIDPPFFNGRIKDYDMKGGGDMVVVCHVWGDLDYLKYLYISLLSNYLFTDISEFDLKIFVGNELMKEGEEKVRELFFPFTDQIYFKDNPYKYFTTFYDEVEEYEFIAHIDSDLFFYGKKRNFYTSILKYFRKYKREGKECPYICFGDYKYRSNEFRLCNWAIGRDVVNPQNYDEVKNFLVRCPLDFDRNDITNWLKNAIWPWNIFYSYNKENYSDDEFGSFIKWWYQETNEWWEEEKIYWIYSNFKNYSLKGINDIFNENVEAVYPYEYSAVNISSMKKYNDSDLSEETIKNNLKNIFPKESYDKLYLIHPIVYHKEFLTFNFRVNSLLKSIITRAKIEFSYN